MNPLSKADLWVKNLGAYNALKLRSIEPLITEIKEIEDAINAYIKRTIIDHPERLP